MQSPDKLQFKLVTPDGIVYDDAIDQVSIPTAAGEITVLPRHIPLVSIISAGELRLKKDGAEIPLVVSGGVLEIRPGSQLYVLADTAERAEHIDMERAEAARARAEELMKQKEQMADVDFARLQAKMEKELARLRVGRKYRKI
ncbi:MAG: F0F1 ATP synthase subunit epsilon [Candidatus Magasanikbacteria bacterium GW2011_GWA2_56_11]|uniref:ATP synthase epsilon chain n=1 Tax=Candidatus Magasanikbacteria bacterium GW2011_GWA2_56_11 TaxID=1619044 RepID=A0A0G2AME6_9BACT|nr:MAG: F0F1 ATP synthase subunit epsilon [Candidatus Magasanikbacteria bacterium GW2011_GWA2_56_11]